MRIGIHCAESANRQQSGSHPGTSDVRVPMLLCNMGIAPRRSKLIERRVH